MLEQLLSLKALKLYLCVKKKSNQQDYIFSKTYQKSKLQILLQIERDRETPVKSVQGQFQSYSLNGVSPVLGKNGRTEQNKKYTKIQLKQQC